jgi:hypothetical protein
MLLKFSTTEENPECNDSLIKLCAEPISERKYSVKFQRPSAVNAERPKRRRLSIPNSGLSAENSLDQSSIVNVVTRSGRKAGYFVSSSKRSKR